MFNNIGKKFKVLAKVMFWLQAIGAVITGIILLAEDDELLIYSLLLILAGPLYAWISSWFLYGFGELIDKAADIEYNTRRGNGKGASRVADEKIQKYEKLLKQGLITAEEYQGLISK